MEFTATVSGDTLYLSWSSRSPSTEQDLHRLGGDWEDFNVYRFGFDEITTKNVLKYAKMNGQLKYAGNSLDLIKAMVKKAREAEKLTQGDADAEISPLLKKCAPRTAQALRPYQRAGVKFLATNDSSLLADDPGSGKAQPLSEPVLTPKGFVPMGEITPGMEVIGKNGKPTRVLKVFPQGERQIYRVSFRDGTSVRCDADHLWEVQNKRQRTITGKKQVLTTREIIAQGVLKPDGRANFSIPLVEPVEFPKKKFPLDPYLYGVLLGDGGVTTHTANLTSDKEIVDSLNLPEGVTTRLIKDEGWWGEYRLRGLMTILKRENVERARSEHKRIDQRVLMSSAEDRLAVLQGLLDTDGETSKSRGKNSSNVTFGSTSKGLIEDVSFIVRSLGGVASEYGVKETTFTHKGELRRGQDFYRVNIALPQGMAPFRLSRKLERWVPRSKYPATKFIVSIEEDGVEEAQCILVESEDHLYVTRDFAVTHNTVQTIAAIISAGVEGDILVLAPTVAANISWPEEMRKWSPRDEAIIVAGNRKKREEALAKLTKRSQAPRRWVFCNTEMVRTNYVEKHVDDEGRVYPSKYTHHYPELFYLTKDQKQPREWSAIIVDEAHNALITDKSQAYKQTLTRRGFSKLATKPGGKRIAISGTPFRGKPQNLWGILNWLFPDTYKSYWKWAERWFEIQKGYFGGVEDMSLKETSKKAFYKSIQPIMIRRTKAEVAPDLPPKMYAGSLPPGISYDHPSQKEGLVGHWLEMEPKQQRAYEEMEEFATAALDNGTLVANGVLAELTRLKQFATSYGKLDTRIDSEGFEVPTFSPSLPSNKLTWLLEFLQELGIDGKYHKDTRKVVVASQFTSIINSFAEEIEKKLKGVKVLKITGAVNMNDRQDAVDKFQHDDAYPILMLNTKAGGVALTLDRADDIVILDETFIPDDQSQVEDRIHRVSRMHSVTVHYVRSIGTVEEKIAKKTIDRDNLQKQLLDGARGVSYARNLLGK